MLTIEGAGDRTCDGVTRRDFVQAGSLGLGGIGLPGLLAARAASVASRSDFVRDKAVVLLYLSGGASHIETFDPKMTAPDGVRSMTGAVATRIPGVAFGGTFPQLASHADKLAVVRSFTHSVGSHEQAHVHVLSGGSDPVGQRKEGFSMGSATARLRGPNDPVTGMPTYALLTEEEIDSQYQRELGRVIAGSWPGTLGAATAPFRHETGWRTEAIDPKPARRDVDRNQSSNMLASNMRLNLPREVLDDRMRLLRAVDGLRRRADANGTMEAIDEFTAQALELVLGGAAAAFDFRREDPRRVERYDTSHIQIGHKTFRPSTLGQQMLVARRLCEAGCGFVTVHSAGWDMHADGNNPGILRGMEMLGRALDQAVSAFLEDVDERGLAGRILLVITGDFGRTPKVNSRGGRDHWARLGTLALAGGGLRMGQIIGESARGADVPATDPIAPADLMATVMHTLFDIGRLRLAPGVPRDLFRHLETGRPITPLL